MLGHLLLLLLLLLLLMLMLLLLLLLLRMLLLPHWLLSLLFQLETCSQTVLDFLDLLLLPLGSSIVWSENVRHQALNVMRQAGGLQRQVGVHGRVPGVVRRRFRVAKVDRKPVDLLLSQVHAARDLWLLVRDRVVHQLAQ